MATTNDPNYRPEDAQPATHYSFSLNDLQKYFNFTAEGASCDPITAFPTSGEVNDNVWKGFVFQMVDVFVMGTVLTGGFLWYVGNLSIFTLAIPLIGGLATTFIGFAYICSFNTAGCFNTVISSVLSVLEEVVKDVLCWVANHIGDVPVVGIVLGPIGSFIKLVVSCPDKKDTKSATASMNKTGPS